MKDMINMSKKAQFVKDLNNAHSMKSKWNLIRAQGRCDDSTTSDREILNNFDLNDLNSHFASIHGSDGADMNNLFSDNPDMAAGDFRFSAITASELGIAFNRIKINTMGGDGVPIKFWKLIIDMIADQIMYIVHI